MSFYDECPECEGAIMDMDTDSSFKCPRCGYRCDEFGTKIIHIQITKGCNNLVEVDTYDEDGYFKGMEKVYCNDEDLCDECSSNLNKESQDD